MDTLLCLIIGFLWPMTIFIFAIFYLKNSNITIFPFKKWYDKEVNKNKVK